MTRPTLTERRGEELRLAVALAARDIFLAEGNTTATIERICDAAGIAARTFHRHFPAKEDVVMPLLRQYGNLSVRILNEAAADSGTAATLVRAFSGEVSKRGEFEIDRQFMALIIADPQYRLRWLDWGQDLAEPITEFLDRRVDLGSDPFTRTLPAQLIIQIGRQAYIHWVERGDFTDLESTLRAGIDIVLRALTPLS